MENVYKAIEYATPIWRQAVFQLTWPHGLVAGAYGVVAWLCFMNARLTKETLGKCSIWCLAVTLLCFLGANVLLQGDVFVTHVIRTLARLQGWYEQRRELQYVLISVVALSVLVLGNKTCQRYELYAQSDIGMVSAGLVALVLLLAVRTVSAHGIDAVINTRFAGVSIGRLLELLGMACVAFGALRSLRQPWAQLTLRSPGGRHV